MMDERCCNGSIAHNVGCPESKRMSEEMNERSRQCDWCTVNEQHCYGRLEYCNCDCTNG